MDRREFLRQSRGVISGAALSGLAMRARSALAETESGARAARRPATGPLRVHPDNPRYFADSAGKAVYLTGSHTWADFQERALPDTPEFDFEAFLDFLVSHGHNFIRLWRWEHAAWMQFTDRTIRYRPHPYPRTGPGKAQDGLPKFDLGRFNQQYFDRLRRRVLAAGERGIYVAVMLFQGFSIEQKGTEGVDPNKGNPWDGHPFHRQNNISGIDGDPNADGEGKETHTLAIPAVTRLQEAYVRKVIDTVGDLDNVLYEISNESHGGSTEWQYHFIRFIHDCERDNGKRHPVGMTFQWGREDRGTNRHLFESPAEWISPNFEGGYRDDPPPADGRKVILSDTDHLWGIGGSAAWVWKTFLRGLNPIFMDPYLDARTGHRVDPKWNPIRRAMGQTSARAQRVDLVNMIPQPELASSGYCLAHAAKADAEYLVYLPSGGEVTVDLSATPGELAAEWFDPGAGRISQGETCAGGSRRQLAAPFRGDAVLYLHKRE